MAYDALNRLTQTTDAANQTTHREYDLVGNLTVFTDALGKDTTMAYDDLNPLVSTQDATLGVTTLVYDPVGNVVERIDPANNHATMIYDALDRLVSQTDGLNHTTTLAYDAVGNRTGLTDASTNHNHRADTHLWEGIQAPHEKPQRAVLPDLEKFLTVVEVADDLQGFSGLSFPVLRRFLRSAGRGDNLEVVCQDKGV